MRYLLTHKWQIACVLSVLVWVMPGRHWLEIRERVTPEVLKDATTPREQPSCVELYGLTQDADMLSLSPEKGAYRGMMWFKHHERRWHWPWWTKYKHPIDVMWDDDLTAAEVNAHGHAWVTNGEDCQSRGKIS